MSTNPLWLQRHEKEIPVADQRDRGDDWANHRITDRVQYYLIFLAAFIGLLAAGVVALLLPWTWSRRFGPDGDRWFVGRAWEDAGTFTELSFMG